MELHKKKELEINKSLFYRITHPLMSKRFLFFFASDILIIVFSLYISFFIRFEFTMSAGYRSMFLEIISLFIVVKLMVFAYFRLYKITWRYVGLHDLLNIVKAVFVSGLVLMVLPLIPFPPSSSVYLSKYFSFNTHIEGFPKSIYLIDGFITLFLLCGLRVSKRLFSEVVRKKNITKSGKRTIILGAGNTGEMILRDMARQSFCEYDPVGFLDDDKSKINMYVRGIKVLGTMNRLKDVISRYRVEAVIIAIPSLNYHVLKEIYNLAKNARVHTIKIVPRIYDHHKPEINTKGLEDISIEDLLGRQSVHVDYKGIKGFLRDKIVLITGAGGSIGSEITRQVCSFQPERVILFDIDETELHTMKLKLEKMFPYLFLRQPECVGGNGRGGDGGKREGRTDDSRIQDKVIFVTGDIRDKDVVEEVFGTFKPQIVFHAAAYKHVPMMESNPKEAVKVNMFGTYRIAEVSVRHHVEKFILISTDKAVRPTSVMGATKRVAEYICKGFNNAGGQNGKNGTRTEFVSVRFGNVLGSRGSVLPLFLDQLKYGGPLTVTHNDMKRYFMTIPEAVSLVLQASVVGKGGEVLVLDMGEPVRIVSLAEELIRVHGMQPYKDIKIKFTGLRPGEKLFEEILTAEEGTTAGMHERVFIAKNGEKYSRDDIELILKKFEMVIEESAGDMQESNRQIRNMLKRYVKYYEDVVGKQQVRSADLGSADYADYAGLHKLKTEENPQITQIYTD
jgi:FlaA1/EpsC-like NDP-sugar epimerase